MPTSSMLHVRVDDRLKAEASETLERVGLSISDAVRMLLRRVVVDQALPAVLSDARKTGAKPSATAVRLPIEELDMVRLLADVTTEDGRLPFGSEGTVVYRHGAGEAYEVEFMVPIHAVLTLRANEVEPADG